MKPLNIVAIAVGAGVLLGAGYYGGVRAGVFRDVRGKPGKSMVAGLPTNNGDKKHQKAYAPDDDPSITAESIGPRKWKIIDVHEHVQGEKEAQVLLQEMDKFGVQRTCLMGTTKYTFTLSNRYGFEGFKENNEANIAMKKKWPDRFCAFVTINPLDEGNVALLQDYVKRGADGLKLYIGHGGSSGSGPFHSMPIDDPRMDPVFAWAEEVQLPIVLHVNLDKFWDEMLNVLEKHPYLRVNMPHMGLQKNNEARLKRIGFMLERYPNVYTDMSWGYYTYQQDGFETLAINRKFSRPFMEQHKDKMMYASDMVLEENSAGEPAKPTDYVEDTLRSYMQFLEMSKWRFFLVPKKLMYGEGLDDDTLHHIYEVAPSNWLLLDAAGKLPDRTQRWPIPGVPVPPRPAIPPLTPDMVPPLHPVPVNNGPSGAAPSSTTHEEAPPEKQGGSERERGDDDDESPAPLD
jgi:predicted TIM-barrel fold metal-dependent hydrolase